MDHEVPMERQVVANSDVTYETGNALIFIFRKQ